MNTNQTREQLAKIIDDGSSAEAADFTASVILAECVVIPRADLPEVVESGSNFRVGSIHYVESRPSEERRREALDLLALAEYIDAREAREAEAAKEAELTKRRDALASEVWKAGFGERWGFREYADLNPATQAAVDWLMEAQDKLAKYEEVQA